MAPEENTSNVDFIKKYLAEHGGTQISRDDAIKLYASWQLLLRQRGIADALELPQDEPPIVRNRAVDHDEI